MRDARDSRFVGGLTGDAAWRASLRDADTVGKLRKLEREARGSWFSGNRNDPAVSKKLEAVRLKRRALVAAERNKSGA
jgi:hypothetical protein